MHVTLDTNVFGPVASPEDYSACSSLDDCIAIAEGIRKGQITASISEASVSLEALNKKDRINQFFRSHALPSRKIIFPETVSQTATCNREGLGPRNHSYACSTFRTGICC